MYYFLANHFQHALARPIDGRLFYVKKVDFKVGNWYFELVQLIAVPTIVGFNILWSIPSSLQFHYREVLASPSVLNTPDRVDWKACKGTMEEEKQSATVFRKKFKPFDFNLT